MAERSIGYHGMSEIKPSPYINRFLSPDTIVPGYANPQALNRYSYVNNSPLNFVDPTGHMLIDDECGYQGQDCGSPIPTPPTAPPSVPSGGGGGESQSQPDVPLINGTQLQFSVALGVPAEYYEDYKEFGVHGGPYNHPNIPALIYFGISIVFDKHGGAQIYFLTLDQDPLSLEPGPLQNHTPSYMLAANATIAYGVIYGEGFEEYGTESFEGPARVWSGGLGPASVDYWHGFNNQTGQTDPQLLSGLDFGYSLGSPLSGGYISTYAHPWTPRLQNPFARP